MADLSISHLTQPADVRVCRPEDHDNCQVQPKTAIMMPHDPEGAMEARLSPGEVARLFGWIYVLNDSPLDLDIKMSFRLYQGGLYIEAETLLPNGETAYLGEFLPMNGSYTIQLQEGKLVLIPNGVSTASELKPEQPKAGIRNLNRMSQKG